MQSRAKLALIAVSVTGLMAAGAAFAGHHKGDGERGSRADRMIEQWDADKDGKVTLDEMKAAAAERFARRDLDGDGVVTRADREARRAAHRDEQFDKMDADGDGVISKEEFAAFQPERGERGDRGPRGERGERGKRHAHGGKRGKHGKRGKRMDRHAPLTIQEVEARVEQRFERLDTDAKGYITLEDLEAHRGKRGKRGKRRDRE